jgi:hypothetical protein
VHSYTSPPFDASLFSGGGRVEIVFGGVEHAGPSFEGRVFLNRPDADEHTATTPESGYAGSYHVYAYGWPLPPELAAAKERLGPTGPPAAPEEQRLLPDAAVLRAALERGGEVTVTVVPVPVDPGGPLPERPCESVEVVSRGAG